MMEEKIYFNRKLTDGDRVHSDLIELGFSCMLTISDWRASYIITDCPMSKALTIIGNHTWR